MRHTGGLLFIMNGTFELGMCQTEAFHGDDSRHPLVIPYVCWNSECSSSVFHRFSCSSVTLEQSARANGKAGGLYNPALVLAPAFARYASMNQHQHRNLQESLKTCFARDWANEAYLGVHETQ